MARVVYSPEKLLLYNVFMSIMIVYYLVEIPFVLFFRAEGTHQLM
jgi:hypothetical protein